MGRIGHMLDQPPHLFKSLLMDNMHVRDVLPLFNASAQDLSRLIQSGDGEAFGTFLSDLKTHYMGAQGGESERSLGERRSME
jgi:hypothetical protein